MRAASPRAATSSMIAATAASTSAALSRFAVSSAAKAASKPGSQVRRVTGMSGRSRAGAGQPLLRLADRGAEALDPAADLFRPGFQRRAVDDEPRGDVGDMLDLDETIRLQCRAG